MSSLAYPVELETHWVQVAQTETRATTIRDVLRRMRPDIQRLADRFTVDRAAAEAAAAPYLRDTRACAAYSLFFAPQAYARLAHILAELPPLPETAQPLRVLDLGAGTGAAAWALLDHLGRRPVALTAWDHSRPALRCLHELFTALRRARWPEATLRTNPEALENFAVSSEKYDVVLLHYVLNELSPAVRRTLLSRAARSLAPNGRIIVCEPLVHDAGDYLRDLRAYALSDLQLHILAPCPHEQACPLDGPCHDVRTWKLSQGLQILNSSLHRDLRHLAYAFLVLSPQAPDAAPILRARVVGSPTRAKGQTLCPACCSDGQIHRLQLLHRDVDTAGRKALRHLERGQILRLAELVPLGDPSLFRAVPAPA
ncbi:MAG: small ribosomal subunit Rsm22 family protein [Kiritimatiellia bacterium]